MERGEEREETEEGTGDKADRESLTFNSEGVHRDITHSQSQLQRRACLSLMPQTAHGMGPTEPWAHLSGLADVRCQGCG
jgi:hypothetical protein